VHFIQCTFLHKHLRTCIIQDRKQRIQSWPRQTRTLRNFRSAPITARVPSREVSPGAFSPSVCNHLTNVLLYLIHYVQKLSATVAALYLVYLRILYPLHVKFVTLFCGALFNYWNCCFLRKCIVNHL
jgi:hypothetical protein